MRDVYSEITDRIVASLEHGVQPWFKPWSGDNNESFVRPLRHNGMPYQGINVVILWMTQMERGYSNPYWMTYKQAQEFGANVRKGEKGTTVVYAGIGVKTNEANENETFNYLKTYSVFNADQIDGLPEKYKMYVDTSEVVINNHERIPSADEFFENLNMDLRHGGNKAFYHPNSDYVQIPEFSKFKDATSYYCTLGHESAHWTKHESRLDRDLSKKKWSTEGYAMEELVAELASAFLAADLGLVAQPREDHASYIEYWLKVIKNDKRAIFQMASLAEKAVTYLKSLQPIEQAIAA